MVALSLMIPFVIIALVVLLMIAIRNADQDKERSHDIMKNIYVYLVLFATLMMVIGGSVSAFMALADIVSPAPYHQSFEEYKLWGPDYDNERIKDKTHEELKESYDEMIKTHKENAHSQAINTLIKSFGWIVIPLPIFIMFQRRLPRKA